MPPACSTRGKRQNFATAPEKAPSRTAGLSCSCYGTRLVPATPGLKPMRAGAQGFRVELPPEVSIDGLPAASPPAVGKLHFEIQRPSGRFFFVQPPFRAMVNLAPRARWPELMMTSSGGGGDG